MSQHPNIPAFSGGLLDAWPAWWVDAEPVLREESAAIRRFMAWRCSRG